MKEMTPQAPWHPRSKGVGSRWPWFLLARDMGALAAVRGGEGKGPEPPGTWGPPGGPQGAPGRFSSGPGAPGNQPPWRPSGVVGGIICFDVIGDPSHPGTNNKRHTSEKKKIP